MLQNGRPDTKKVCFHDKMASEWDLRSSREIIVSLGDFNGDIRKCAEGFKDVHGEMVLEKEMQKEEDCWSSVMKKSCAKQTHGFTGQRKGTSLIARVNQKQKLLLCFWRKNTESM